MTRISTNLGGAAPSSGERGVGGVAPGGQSQQWRDQSYQAYIKGGGVDWNSPEYASPQPPPKTKFGRRVQVPSDVPELPMTHVRVRANPPRTYYDADGRPISPEWSLVPLSADIMDAVKNGDLEQDKSYKEDKSQSAPQPHARRHHTPAAE